MGVACPKIGGRVPENVAEKSGSRARKCRRKFGVVCPNIVPEIFCPNKVPECLARKLWQKMPCPKVPPIVCPNFVTEFQCKESTRFITIKSEPVSACFWTVHAAAGHPQLGRLLSGTNFGHRFRALFSGTDFRALISGINFRAQISGHIFHPP